MLLAHRSLEMDAWHCDSCGFVHTITPDGAYVASTDPREEVRTPHVQFVERANLDARFGRITNMEGG